MDPINIPHFCEHIIAYIPYIMPAPWILWQWGILHCPVPWRPGPNLETRCESFQLGCCLGLADSGTDGDLIEVYVFLSNGEYDFEQTLLKME